MKLSRELNLFIAGGMVMVGVILAGISAFSMNVSRHKEMDHLRTLLETERKAKLRDMVKGAYSVLDTANFYETAQDALQNMRFGENEQNYYLVVDTDGMVWVNPFSPEQVGKINLEVTDPDGQPYIRQIIDTARREKEGFLSYRETPTDMTEPVTRLLYFKYFDKWKWIVCAGMYMHDIELLLQEKEAEIRTDMLTQASVIFLLMAVLVMVGIKTSTWLISKRIVNPLVEITQAAQKIGMGDFNTRISVKSNEEINLLADSLKRMQKSLDMAIKRARRVREKRSGRDPLESVSMDESGLYVTTFPVNDPNPVKIQ